MIKLQFDSWVIIILLGLGIILYAKIVTKSDTQPMQKKLYEEMEDTFENFAMEIEEENKQLLEYIMTLKHKHEKDNSILLSRLEQLEKQFLNTTLTYQLKLEKDNEIIQNTNVTKDNDNDKKVVPESVTVSKPISFENDMKERYHDLFKLYNQGKSVEYIAKKIEMNKGEVQLIIQLANQGDKFSV